MSFLYMSFFHFDVYLINLLINDEQVAKFDSLNLSTYFSVIWQRMLMPSYFYLLSKVENICLESC